MGHQKTTKMTTTIKTTRICKGIYQTEWNGHIIQISDESESVEGQLKWCISSETLDLERKENEFGTLYATKAEAIYMLPDVLRTAMPY